MDNRSMDDINLKSKSKKVSKGRYILKLIAIALAEIIVFCSGFLGGMYFDNIELPSKKEKIPGIQVPVSEYVAENNGADDAARAMIDDMTTSELIYQMMFVTPESITGVGKVLRAGDTTPVMDSGVTNII